MLGLLHLLWPCYNKICATRWDSQMYCKGKGDVVTLSLMDWIVEGRENKAEVQVVMTLLLVGFCSRYSVKRITPLHHNTLMPPFSEYHSNYIIKSISRDVQ